MSILLKPVISEKANKDSEQRNRYTFFVNPKANKIEIKAAVEKSFGVNVLDVKTMIYAPTVKRKFTKTGVQVAKSNKLKKALIDVEEGQTIDIFNL